jgi:hypothetical protein
MDKLKDINDAIRCNVEEAYRRGFSDGVDSAKAELLSALSGVSPKHKPEDGTEDVQRLAAPLVETTRKIDASTGYSERKRAPRGLPRDLSTRAMQANPNGVTPQDIADYAVTDFEKMIAMSSIRSELRQGEKDGRYKETGGLWFLRNEMNYGF